MNILSQGRNAWRAVADLLFPGDDGGDLDDLAGGRASEVLWLELFDPFHPVVEGADVLVLGQGDVDLSLKLTNDLRARAVTSAPDDLALLEAGGFDLVLTRSIEEVTRLERLEEDLGQVYAALRPGGEWLLRAGCPTPSRPGFEGPGFGMLTPSGWALQFMRAGFEIAELRPVWRDQAAQGAVAELLPQASDSERLCGEIRARLIRPWEAWELAALNR